MAYLLECRDKPDSAALRQETRQAHLAYARETPAILAAGPLLAEDESTMIGSFFILDFPDRAAVEAFNANDPYTQAGLFGSVRIQPFRWLMGTGPRPANSAHEGALPPSRRGSAPATLRRTGHGWHYRHCSGGGRGPALDAALAEAEVLWHCLYPIDAAVLEKAPKLRLIQKIGVGVNTIDRETAAARGVTVCNLPGSNAPAVAEHTLALMLATLRQIPQLDAAMRQGQGWALTPKLEDGLGELYGRRVGLVGWGATAQQLAPVLDALGATVAFCAQHAHAAPYAQRSFEDLLAESDVLSLHLPLTEATARMLDANALARLPAGAIIINTARGGLIDESALLGALGSGALAGAGLDVFDQEPLSEDHPFLTLPQVVLTPHSAWLTQETLRRSLTTAVANLHGLHSGGPFHHEVPPP